MPFRSERQRRYMHSQHPEIAERWERRYGSKPSPKAPQRAYQRTRRKKRPRPTT